MADDGSGGRGGVSRRDLLGGFLKRPLHEIQSRIPEALRNAAPLGPGSRAGSPSPRASYPKRLRVQSDTVRATADASGNFLVDLGAAPLAVGQSRRVVAAELGEALVVVRVSEEHHAAATGECPVDGSDVLWHAPQEVLWCPGCGSRWRLDGSVVCAPARTPLLSIHVDEAEGVLRLDVP